MTVQFGVGLPNVGEYGDPQLLVELASEAEAAGWGGVFLWDHLLYRTPGWPVADATVTIAAIASHTSTVRCGVLLTALARRRPWKFAHELLTLDHLSGGRITCGVGLGSLTTEFDAFGESADPRHRAAILDESLSILDPLLRGDRCDLDGRSYHLDAARLALDPRQKPRPPIWVGGRWPNRRPFRRAAAWDGVFPTHTDFGLGETMPPEVLGEIVAYVSEHREKESPFDVILEGQTSPSSNITRYEQAGLTWWIEALGWWRGSVSHTRRRIRAGPPSDR